jgi:hypothetical protein
MEHIVTGYENLNFVYWLWSCYACFHVDSHAPSDFITARIS